MDNDVLELQIVSKSPYGRLKNRWCYLGIDVNNGNLLRPIPALGLSNEAEFFWPQDDWQVGATYKFKVIQIDPESVHFPHRNDDVLVSYASQTSEATTDRVAALLGDLRKRAKPTIQEALSIPEGMMEKCGNGRKYVEEGTDCYSCGVVNEESHLEIVELARPFAADGSFNPRRCFEKNVGKFPL